MAARVEKFLLVGTLGLGLSLAGLWLLHGKLGIPLSRASIVAIFASMAVTFLLNELWTWGDRPVRSSFPTRSALYFVINSVGMLINWQVLLFLHHHQSLHYQMANVVGAAMAAVWNFGLNNLVTWRV